MAESSCEAENGNHFLRLKSTEAGKTILLYRSIDLPANVRALELKWRQRVSDLKVGKEAWHDARIILNFKSADGKQLSSPSAPYSRGDTKGWEDRTETFLVPQGAVRLEFMPALFQVEQGTFDLDDITLKAVDPAPLLAAARAREAEDKRNTVAVEGAWTRRVDQARSGGREVHAEKNALTVREFQMRNNALLRCEISQSLLLDRLQPNQEGKYDAA